MSDRDAAAVNEEILALVQRCLSKLDGCQGHTCEMIAILDRLIDKGAEIDSKMASMDSLVALIHRHL